MIFSSNMFVFIFLPITLFGYQVLSSFGRSVVLVWLTLTSLFFYGFWNPPYLLLLLASILFNYFIASLIHSSKDNDKQQNRWLIAGICTNLLLLCYYKYLFTFLNFLYQHGVFHHGFESVALPLGISFFTFTQIAFLIDLKQGIAEVQSPISFSLFVTFFPHLIAGPILHPREMIPQFRLHESRRGLNPNDLAIGLTWFVMGLAKKVLIADRIAPVADIVFAQPTSFGTGATWIGVLTYTMQLYFDFSGYSDMAIGLARMFSIQFPANFNSPYKAKSIVEFWARWHMTLSRYFNEYVYNPIAQRARKARSEAGRQTTRKSYATLGGFTQLIAFPTFATLLLAGVWHGAGLQFLMYGLLLGIFITVYHFWRIKVPKENLLNRCLPAPVSVVLTYLCFTIAVTFFRSGSTHQAFYIISSLSGMNGIGSAYTGNPLVQSIAYFNTAKHAVFALIACFVIVWFFPNTQQILGQEPRDEEGVRVSKFTVPISWKPSFLWCTCFSILFFVCILMMDRQGVFLYFQF